MIKRKQSTTDLQEAEWQIVQNWFSKPEVQQKRGRKRSHELRELINALR
jgi:putative transposase